MYPSPDFGSLSLGKAGVRSHAKMLAEALKTKSIRVGTVTICGIINPDDEKHNPDRIAENYWDFYRTRLASYKTCKIALIPNPCILKTELDPPPSP